MRLISVPGGVAEPSTFATLQPDEQAFLITCSNVAEVEQFEILMEALQRYSSRNVRYQDNWKRMGWRGMLVRVRERAERLWDSLWDAGPSLAHSHLPAADSELDDAIDLINFACFLVRAVRDGNRDGTWWS